MIKQITAITTMNLATLRSRSSAAAVIVIGMICVVAVTVSMLSMSAGIMRSVHATGRADRAMVLSQNVRFEVSSAVPRDAVPTALDAPGVARAPDGKPLGSAEALGPAQVVKKTTGTVTIATLRGIGPEAFALRPTMKIVEGRMFRPAVHEVIVGTFAQGQFKGMNVGDKIALPEGDWTIVGSFESGGDLHQSEILADAETVLSAYRRNTFNSVTVQLTNATAFDGFKDALTSNPAVAVSVTRENEYYENQSKQINQMLSLVAYWVGGIMALGATFGALTTMFAAVSSRTIEIATLRAVGFNAVPVVISIFVESLFLAGTGAAIGGALAWLAFANNQHGFGPFVIRLTVSPQMVAGGVLAGAAVGMIGALFPAIRAARLPVATALQVR